MTFANLTTNPDQAIALFQRISIDDQLAVLWFTYTQIGKSVTPAAPGAASSDIVSGLFEQVRQLSHLDQLEAMRGIAASRDTLISREYGSLSPDTKLSFWYSLAQGMENGTIVPMPENYQLADDANSILAAIETLNFEQQITILRNVVLAMGAEPKVGAAL